MNITIFLGPSLRENDARAVLEADYRAPVSQGDVYRAVLDGAQIIGIVDGYFERIPAVWHKEILWALSRGVHVFGASSMGALRAAELSSFGMTGIGSVFEAFRRGELEDDDEVTIAHGPKELGYPATSEAMVNIRGTLADALAEGVVSRNTCTTLLTIAKSLYYPLRNYDTILEQASGDQEVPGAELDALRQWLPTGRKDYKKTDALELLRTVKERVDGGLAPFQPSFQFETTDAWEQVARRTGRQVAAAIPDDLPMDLILEELRLDGTAYSKTLGIALSRALSLREAERQGATVDRERFRAVLNNFFAQRGLTTPDAIKAWMSNQDVDADGLTNLIQRELKVGLVETLFRDDIMAQIPDSLRVGGIYGDVVSRSKAKQQWLTENGYDSVSLEACELDEDELLAWHFRKRRNQDIPKDLDSYAQSLGLGNRFDFLQALLRDYLFEEKAGS